MHKFISFFFVLLLGASLNLIAQDDEADVSVEEVIVTATSRESTVLDVPYNISTISGNEIKDRSILDSNELLRNFAGISTIDRGYRNAGTTSNIRIRGLNVDSSALQDYPVSAVSSVSTYVDKTPIFANFLLKDLKRVEVLRGPQGTLYGSGALGGTVRYITNDPQIGIFEGSVNYTGSSVDGSDSIGNSLDLVLNVPLGERAAYRVAISELDYPGITDYVNVFEIADIPAVGTADASVGVPVSKNGNSFPEFITSPPVVNSVDDADTVEISFTRHKLMLDISDKLQLVLSSTSQDDAIGGRRQASTGTKYVLNDSCTSLQSQDCYSQSTYGDYENGAVMLEPSNRDVSLQSMELTYDADGYDLIISQSSHKKTGNSVTDNTGYFAGIGTFTSAVAGYYNQAVGGIWSAPSRPYAPTNRQYENSADTLEVKVVSEVGDVYDFVFGYFKQDEDQSRAQQTFIKGVNLWKYYYWGVDYVVDPLEQDFDYSVNEKIENEAYFGEMTFHFNEKLDATIGYRKFKADADADMNMSFKLYDVGPAIASKSNLDKGTLTKFNLSYKNSDTQNYFLTVSEGFRRGGVNAVPTSGTFIEESGWVPFEADTSKNVEAGVKGKLDNGTYYNVSFYSVGWDNPQLNTSTPNYGYYAVINGDKAETQGFDLELSGTINSIDWNFGYAYNDTKLTEDLYTPASVPVLYASSGAKLPGSPESTINFNLAHTTYLESGIGLVSRLDLYHQSETRNYIGEDSLYDAEFDGFQIVNASITAFREDAYISLFIKNIANERGVTGAFLNPAFGPQPNQGFYGSNNREFFALPRTIGISINKDF